MNETITRDGDIITIKSEVVKTIDLGALKAELAELEAIEEPSDEEILALAKQGIVNPHYDLQQRIDHLRLEIERWQKI